MKIINVLSVIAVSGILFYSHPTTPVSFFGSNPYFSNLLFPQDVLLKGGNFFYIYPGYQSAPWWGDITNPTNKPKTGDYSVTGVQIIENNASFNHSGSMQSLDNDFGYTGRVRDNVMANLELNYGIDALHNHAYGTMTGDSIYSEVAHGTIPFDYSNRHTFDRFSIQGMVGTNVRDYPAGLKFSWGFENTLSLKKEISFSKLEKTSATTYDSAKYDSYHFYDDSARALWGWSTRGCNHIFGTKETQGDAWLQDYYALGPLYHFDLTGGITLPQFKGGFYYRQKWGHQDQYAWHYPDTITMVDTVIQRNFISRYEKESLSRINDAWEGRLFGNINHKTGDRYKFNTFVSLGFIDSVTGDALAENLEVQNDSKEKMWTLALEADPNINIKFGDFLNYLDAALILDYQYSRFSNTYNAGGKVTYWTTSVITGDEEIWEHFSYANQNSMHFGLDFSTMFPLYSSVTNRLGLGLMLVGNLKYTFQTKYYGTNTPNSNTPSFTVDNLRKNTMRELWFNSFLMLHYLVGPYQLRLEFTEPILYSVRPGTKVTDASGGAITYDHAKSPLWISQQGLRAAIYASYDVRLPFLRAQKGN